MMNEVIEAIKTRRSVRAFRPDAVPCELLDQVIEAGLYAPSGRGKQAVKIIAVTDRELRDRLSDLNRTIGGWQEGFDPFYGAPAVLLVIADKTVPTYLYDGSLVMGSLMLAAHSLGLGSCWIHRAKEELETDLGKEILARAGITGEYEGIGHCVLGYAKDPLPEAPPRSSGRVSYIK